jgi:uncharacterized protein (DUF927 family)
MAKCSKYHAKCKVTMPKCSEYHAKTTGSSSKLLQMQGKWYRERKPNKNPRPEAKKSKNYSTPHIYILLDLEGPLADPDQHCQSIQSTKTATTEAKPPMAAPSS